LLFLLLLFVHVLEALGLRPSDTFASEMLRRALDESLEGTEGWMDEVPEEP